MKNAIETKTNEDGIQYLGNPTQGCPHCGFVDLKIYPEGSANPTLLYYHPGAQCCEPRINDQIRWRIADRSKINGELQRLKDQVDDMQRNAAYMTGKRKQEMELEIQKMHNQITRVEFETRAQLREIDEQLAELKALL